MYIFLMPQNYKNIFDFDFNFFNIKITFIKKS